MTVKLSVVVPHYNDLDNLQRCVGLLRAQTLDPQDFEIIIADNGSAAGLEAVKAAAGPHARVIDAPERGAGPARNAGVAASQGAVLAFVDSDCRPKPDWLEQGLAALAAADTDIVGGRVDAVAADPANPTPVEAFEMVTAFPMHDYLKRKSFVGSGNLFVTREIFVKVGPFRSTVAEDMDWCHRAVALGYRISYADDAAVAHPARADWAELVRKWRRTTSETFALTTERPLGHVRWLLRCFVVLASIGPHSIKMLTTPKLPHMNARLGAVATLARIRIFRFFRGLGLLFGRA